MGKSKIEVVVEAGLFPEQGIHTPAAIHPDRDVMLLEKFQKFNNFVRLHMVIVSAGCGRR
jgi:hypothetical protein